MPSYVIEDHQLTEQELGFLDDSLSILPPEKESSSFGATAHSLNIIFYIKKWFYDSINI